MSESIIILLILPISLFIILFSLGIALTLDDFRRVLSYPKGVTIGLLNLLIISPALAFGLCYVFDLPPLLAVGMVLLGASPGGTTANMLTHLAKGDTALSLTMTGLSSVLAIITVPLLLNWANHHFIPSAAAMQIDMTPIVIKILLITLVPLALGMTIKAYKPDWTARHEPRIKQLAMAVFVLVVFAALWSEREEISSHIERIGLAVLTLNVLAMAISYLLAVLSGLNGPQATAISIELGVHNTTLAMAVGAMVAPEMIIPAAVYGVFMFFTAGLFARWMHQRNA